MLDRPTKLQEYQTYIDGKWCDAASGKKFQTFDPYTGEPWALIPECDAKDVDRACEAAWRAFDKRAVAGDDARPRAARCCAASRGLIEKHAEHLAPDRGARQRQADLGDGARRPSTCRSGSITTAASPTRFTAPWCRRIARITSPTSSRSRSACAPSSRRGTRR